MSLRDRLAGIGCGRILVKRLALPWCYTGVLRRYCKPTLHTSATLELHWCYTGTVLVQGSHFVGATLVLHWHCLATAGVLRALMLHKHRHASGSTTARVLYGYNADSTNIVPMRYPGNAKSAKTYRNQGPERPCRSQTSKEPCSRLRPTPGRQCTSPGERERERQTPGITDPPLRFPRFGRTLVPPAWRDEADLAMARHGTPEIKIISEFRGTIGSLALPTTHPALALPSKYMLVRGAVATLLGNDLRNSSGKVAGAPGIAARCGLAALAGIAADHGFAINHWLAGAHGSRQIPRGRRNLWDARNPLRCRHNPRTNKVAATHCFGRCGVALTSIWGHFGFHLGPIWGRSAAVWYSLVATELHPIPRAKYSSLISARMRKLLTSEQEEIRAARAREARCREGGGGWAMGEEEEKEEDFLASRSSVWARSRNSLSSAERAWASGRNDANARSRMRMASCCAPTSAAEGSSARPPAARRERRVRQSRHHAVLPKSRHPRRGHRGKGRGEQQE